MAALTSVTGYYAPEDPSGTSVSERGHLFNMPSSRKGAPARAMCKISDSRTSLSQSKRRRNGSSRRLIFLELCARTRGPREPGAVPKGIGELLGPREEAKIAGPPYAPFIAPHLHGPPWAPQHPIRRKVKKAGKGRQRRNGGRRAFLSTGQLALHYLRYITAGEVANALPKFGDREPGPYCGIGRCTECGGSFQVRKRSKRRWGTPLARACLCGRFSRGTC